MISVTGLRHRFGDRWILDGIDLSVEKSELVAVMGSSGGGKTTLLRCIAGLIDATEGAIHVDGVDVRANPEEARRHMGMVFQGAALFDYMSVFENVRFALKRVRPQLKESERRDRSMDALRRVGLEGSEAKLPSELSGGMRKRAGLARAIALEPNVLLYDEPTTGLDPVTTYAIDELMTTLQGSLGVTSMVVSHDLASVVRIADRVAFLHQGQLVFVGTTSDFLKADHVAIRELVQKSQAQSVAPTH